jgi:vancomycin resistance protein YoaR
MFKQPYTVKPVFHFNQKKAEKSLKELAVLVNQPAANAQLILNPKQVKIIPHQNAQELPLSENLAILKQAFTKKVIKLKVKVTEPEITTAALKKLKVETLMSEFATIIPPGPLNRLNNIKLAASKLNNWQIKPGEVFSFNAAVGPRTAKAGFLPAPVIEAGNLTLGVGGGICQVSTTLYNAAMLAGLPIKERYLHSNYISAYPAGRDATVVYNALDLKFKNDTDGTIIIKSEVANGKVTFWLYGPKTNRQVEFSQPVIFNIVPFPVKEVVDPALPPGVKLKAQVGVPGRSVKVIRTVKKDGRLLFSEEIFSRYTPRQEIIKLGPTPETTAPIVTTETVSQ